MNATARGNQAAAAAPQSMGPDLIEALGLPRYAPSRPGRAAGLLLGRP